MYFQNKDLHTFLFFVMKIAFIEKGFRYIRYILFKVFIKFVPILKIKKKALTSDLLNFKTAPIAFSI